LTPTGLLMEGDYIHWPGCGWYAISARKGRVSCQAIPGCCLQRWSHSSARLSHCF